MVTPNGGSVLVSAERSGQDIVIKVTDTDTGIGIGIGIGIEPEFLLHVFDRFRQADASSTRRYEQGLALLAQQRLDVLVSDIGMPDIDGFEFLRRVRLLGVEEGGALPAIALTAFTRNEDRRQATIAGFSL